MSLLPLPLMEEGVYLASFAPSTLIWSFTGALTLLFLKLARHKTSIFASSPLCPSCLPCVPLGTTVDPSWSDRLLEGSVASLVVLHLCRFLAAVSLCPCSLPSVHLRHGEQRNVWARTSLTIFTRVAEADLGNGPLELYTSLSFSHPRGARSWALHHCADGTFLRLRCCGAAWWDLRSVSLDLNAQYLF